MTITRTPVRIVADDLTGALDAAAPFVVGAGPFRVGWDRTTAPDAASAALDLGSRGLDARQATGGMAEAAARWWRGWPGLAFKKVDSAWRGHPAAEIAAAMKHGGFGRAIVAPAFPGLGRTTRNGRQFLRADDGSETVVADLAADLRAAGLDAVAADPRTPTTAPVLICDAQDDPALDRIVAAHMRESGRILWCGTGGLAAALARQRPGRAGPPARTRIAPPENGPALVLIGSNHPAARRQGERVASMPGAVALDFDPASGWAIPRLADDRLETGTVLCRFAFAVGTTPRDARAHIRDALDRLVAFMPVPRSVIATGGDTLRSLCDALGASGLMVEGERMPGFPVSVLPDGRWAGVPVTSKSGGFGGAGTLARLLSAPPPTPNGLPGPGPSA